MMQEGDNVIEISSVVFFNLNTLRMQCVCDDVFGKNYSLSAVSSFSEDIDELKKYGFIVRCV